MPRRWAGAALVVVVLLLALVGARLSGIRVAGTPYAPIRSSAPAVGDCIGLVTGVVAEGRPVTSFTVNSVGINEVRFSDCSLPHLGEVVAFRLLTAPASTALSSSAPSTVKPSGLSSAEPSGEPSAEPSGQPSARPSAAVTTPDGGGPDSDGRWCRDVATGYRAHVTFKVRDVSGDGFWKPATGQRFLTILSAPSPFEPSARWAACAIVAPGLQEYLGSYVSSLADTPTPAPFGVCRESDENPLPISCLEPHRIQEFATAMVSGQIPASLVVACGELIARMTGLPDASAGGSLRVAVVPGGTGTDERDASVSCRLEVIGDRTLRATLIGVENGPLPRA